MLKISDDEGRSLETICQNHSLRLKSVVKRRIDRSSFRQEIKEFLKDRISLLLESKPEELLACENAVYDFIYQYRKNLSSTNSVLKTIFNYNAFLKAGLPNSWNAYKLAKALNINTCVYCNRQYTFTIVKDHSKVTRPQFDHFFSKERHPLLAISFYNLIPCCSVCNSSKGDKQLDLKNHFHPYTEAFGTDGIFTWIPKDYNGIIGSSADFKVALLARPTGINKLKIHNHKELFKLEDIYTEHSDYVQEIIYKAHSTNGKYLTWLHKLFGKRVDLDEVYRLALGNYKNEGQFDKRVLSKLTADIASELNFE